MASVSKRTRKLADGSNGDRWVVRYVDPSTGARPSKAFELKKDAEAFKRKVEREIEDGIHTAAAETKSIADAADEYLKHCEQRCADGRIGRSHLIRETRVVRKHITPALGKLPFRDLTAAQVERLYQTMTAGRVSPMSAKSYLVTFQAMERFARKRGYTKAQPVADALSELRGIRQPRIRTFTEDEVRAILAESTRDAVGRSKRDRLRMACLIHLAAICGLRQGEALGLTRDAIDFDNRQLHVRHNLALGDILKGPKSTAGVRTLRLPEQVAALLSEWLGSFYMDNPRGLLFRTRTGGAIYAPNLWRSWRVVLTTCGIPATNFHALRHFHASWLVNHGMPITDVAKLLGHSHFDMTLQVYAHPVMRSQEREQRLDRIAGLLIDARETHEIASA